MTQPQPPSPTGPWIDRCERLLRRVGALRPGEPLLMSRVGLAFDDYLRRRDFSRPRDFSRLRSPGRPGLVSIVLPVYNGEDYLREALDSVLAQTWPEWELIVVNDGSTDATAAIVEEYARRDGRIVAVHQANQKLPGALNAGFRRARGEFLTWTSADNRLRPAFLERLVRELRERPEVDMVYADYDLIDGRGAPLRGSDWCVPFQDPPGSEHIRPTGDVSMLNLVDGNYVGAAFLYRDRVARLVGGYATRFFTCEDYDFFMRVNERLALRRARTREILYEYRLHGGSLTANKDAFGRDARTRALMVFDDFRRDFALHPVAWRVGAASGDAPAQSLAAALGRQAAEAGGLILEDGAAWGELPRLWFPAVAAWVASTPEAPAPEGFLSAPPHVLKVLIHAGEGAPAAPAPEGWDLCLAASAAEPPPGSGWFATDCMATLRAALELRARALQEAALDAAAAAPSEQELAASVVICTYRRSERLRRALRSACRQGGDGWAYEVIVVNNNPGEDLSEVVEACRREACAGAPERLRLITCPHRGLSFARNAGVAAARGEIVTFLDDDAVADEGWLERLLAAYAGEPALGALGGAIRMAQPRPRPWWFKDEFLKFWSAFAPGGAGLRLVSEWTEFPYGANWSARRAALLQSGGFRIAYGRRGRDAGAGEEVVAALLIQRLGYQVGVLPEAGVGHDVEPERYTLGNLWRTVRGGYGVRLRMQSSFYIAPGLSAGGLARHAARRFLAALLPLRQSGPERVEHLLFGLAALRTAGRCLLALLARLRRPRYRD